MGLFTDKEIEYLGQQHIGRLVTEPTWTPRGVSIKGPVTIHETGGESLGPGFGPRWIEITPHWVSSWGVNEAPFAEPVPPRKVSE
ncbi:hypothetical protein [Mycobacterium sp. NPDC050441]|uniref:hypothetical protein n=1 Tax=Mycobacterium sp. NPDC050441 TaxID=3155403 RepID=UPI0033D3BAD2